MPIGGRIGANKTLPTSGSSRTAVAAPTPPATVVLVRAGGVCGQGSLLGSMRALQLLVISSTIHCCNAVHMTGQTPPVTARATHDTAPLLHAVLAAGPPG